MTEVFAARRAIRAAGLLRAFNEAGVLAPADVHVARRLAELAGEEDDAVRLATALAVRGPRLGHVYVDIATIHETATVDAEEPVDLASLPWPDPAGWLDRLRASPLVDGPLRLEGSALYLDRLWREERQIAADLRTLRDAAPADVDEARLADGLARLLDDPRQAEAAETAVRRRFAVVAGGPGTGKTTTVARVVALLLEQGAARRCVALAAPTGKAAARLAQAVHDEAATLAVDPGDPRPPHRPGRVDAAPAARLAPRRAQPLPPRPPQPAAARRRDRRRDLDGLAVADGPADRGRAAGRAAGAGRRPRAAHLDRGRRRARRHRRRRGRRHARRACTGSAARSRAWPTRSGAATATRPWRRCDGVTWIEDDDVEAVRREAVAAARAVVAAARAGRAREALDALGAFRLLCAHRRGPHGVGAWTARVEGWLAEASSRTAAGTPAGRCW